MNEKNNFILTGATGVLGSHIFYELLYKIGKDNYEGEIVLLVRTRNNRSAIERARDLLVSDLIPDYLKETELDRLFTKHVTIIDADLTDLTNLKLAFSGNTKKYKLIHCAASVNLSNSNSAFDEIKSTNYQGTIDLVNTLLPNLIKVSYIGTSLSYRETEDITPFRNHYERFKADTETIIEELCESNGIFFQTLRPSIICGRLIDSPNYVICKFLVFYLFGAFFYRTKIGHGEIKTRIMINPDSGLNIIPVDYAAKAIVRALDTDLKELNIVSSKYLPNTFTIPTLLNEIGWHNFELVHQMPQDLNTIEKLYYRTVGPQLTSYLTSENYPYNMSDLHILMQDIKEPDTYNEFKNLCAYAVEKEFENALV